MSEARATLLRRFGITEAARIGAGGQSIVYALDAARVLRLPQAGRFDAAALRRQRVLLAAIAGRLPFATPAILDMEEAGGWVIEERLPGRSMLALLPSLSRDERTAAWASYLDAAAAIGGIRLEERAFGQIIADPPLTAPTWRGYLEASMRRFAARNAAAITRAAGDAGALLGRALARLADVPANPPRALVHGDFFPGNVLLDARLAVSAVIDFSDFTLAGDPLYDLAGACIFPEMIAETTEEDRALLGRLARERHATEAFGFYRAYFAFFSADPALAAPPYPGMFAWGLRELKALKKESRG